MNNKFDLIITNDDGDVIVLMIRTDDLDFMTNPTPSQRFQFDL